MKLIYLEIDVIYGNDSGCHMLFDKIREKYKLNSLYEGYRIKDVNA